MRQRTNTSLISRLRCKSQFWHIFKLHHFWLIILSVVVAVSRFVGRSYYLYDSDSVLYALAMRNYDVSIHQPHPPGYPLYILVAKLFSGVTDDANLVLVWLSILFSILAIWALFKLAHKIYGTTVAWVAVLLLASGAVFWFHGQVGLNYMVDAFFVSWFASYAYDVIFHQSGSRSLMGMSCILALAGGFRLSFLVLMLPLWLWAVLSRRNWAVFFQQVAIVASLTLLWYLPASWLSGGWLKFWHSFQALLLSRSGVYAFSVFSETGRQNLMQHLNWITRNLVLQFGFSLLPAMIWAMYWLSPKSESRINYKLVMFWLVAILPAIMFYLLVIFNLPGYILILLPLFAVLVAKSIVGITREVGLAVSAVIDKIWRFEYVFLWSLMIVIVGLNIKSYYFPENYTDYQKSVHHSIAMNNLFWSALSETIASNFSPQDTMITIEGPYVSWGIAHFQYYFPQYRIYSGITPGFYNPNAKHWFFVDNGRLQLTDSLEIPADVKKLIVVRGTWANKPYGYTVVPLANNLGYIPYYDLSDPTVRSELSKKDYIKLL